MSQPTFRTPTSATTCARVAGGEVGSWNAPLLRVLEKIGFRRDHVSTGADGEVV
jgi:hypothetical protein